MVKNSGVWRWYRRSRGLTSLTAIGIALALALGAAAQQQPAAAPSGTTDVAYAAGYRAAYPLGQQDQSAGAAANAHKFELYQQALSGYTEQYGTPESYRRAYQSGFSDGYADGYAGRSASIDLTPPPAPPAASAGIGGAPQAPQAPEAPEAPGAVTPVMPNARPASDRSLAPPADLATRTAMAYGYREGYNVGQADANRQAAYDPNSSQEYQAGAVGYQTSLGDADQYKLNFRSGFTSGYADGYHHRLYNSAIGDRSLTLAPAAVATSNPNSEDLPTDPERAAARPSGVYANGLLIAQDTRVQATLNNTINTKTARVGDAFSATVSVPVWVGSVEAIPAGSTIQGVIQDVKSAGKFGGAARLQLRYDTLTLPGKAAIPLNAATAGVGDNPNATVNGNEGTVNGQSPQAGKKIGTGAAIGAVLGGIFGGGHGVLRGGAAGAAAGTAGVLLSHKQDLVLREGDPISLRLERPLELPKPNPTVN